MTLRRASVVLLSLVLTGAAIYLAPVQAGGQTSFAVTDGISMNPMLHAGDLVVTRTAASYRVGDVVLYDNSFLHRQVLHRILKIQHSRYYFKGDNNDFVDPGYATQGQLVGKLWFHIPKAGLVLTWIGRPSHSGLFATGVALLLILGFRASGKRKKRRKRAGGVVAAAPRRLFHRPRKTLENGVFFGAGLLACTVAAVAFATPLHRVGVIANAYTQRGAFTYSGPATGLAEVYPSGSVRTGQTIFLASVRRLRLRFAYHFDSSRPHGVKGTAEMRVLISSDAISWHDVVGEKTVPFTGDSAVVGETLDLARIQQLGEHLVNVSGAVGADYRLIVEPVVKVHGLVGGTLVHETFAPTLPMQMTQSMLKVTPSAPTTLPGATYQTPSADSLLTAALDPTKTGTIPGSTANTLAVLRYRIPVSDFRGLALGLAALALLALLLKPLRPKREIWSNERRIAFRHGCVLVGVTEIAASPETAIVAVPRFEDLASLAEQQDAPIMHAASEGGARYAVEHGRHLYVFEAPPAPEATPSTPPPPKPAPRPRPRHRHRPRLLLHGMALLAVAIIASIAVGFGFTATTTVPPSNAGTVSKPLSVTQIAPSACSGLGLTGVLYVTTNSFSNNQSHMLIIGRSVNDNIADAGRSDCIVAGGGQDTVNAQAGSVCITNTNSKSNYKGCTKS